MRMVYVCLNRVNLPLKRCISKSLPSKGDGPDFYGYFKTFLISSSANIFHLIIQTFSCDFSKKISPIKMILLILACKFNISLEKTTRQLPSLLNGQVVKLSLLWSEHGSFQDVDVYVMLPFKIAPKWPTHQNFLSFHFKRKEQAMVQLLNYTEYISP